MSLCVYCVLRTHGKINSIRRWSEKRQQQLKYIYICKFKMATGFGQFNFFLFLYSCMFSARSCAHGFPENWSLNPFNIHWIHFSCLFHMLFFNRISHFYTIFLICLFCFFFVRIGILQNEKRMHKWITV